MFDRCRNAERPECRLTGLTTMSRYQVMVRTIAVWLGSALRPRPTARAYCDVCLLFITAPSSLFPRHLIRSDYRVIAIYSTAASNVRGSLAMRKSAKHSLFVTNFQSVSVVYKDVLSRLWYFCNEWNSVACNTTIRRLLCFHVLIKISCLTTTFRM